MKKVIFTAVALVAAVSMMITSFAMPYEADGTSPTYYGDGTNENWGGASVGSYGILCDFEQEKTWGGSICCDMNNGVPLSYTPTDLRTRNDWTPTREEKDRNDESLDWTAHIVADGAEGNHAVEVDREFALWNDYFLDMNYRLQCDFKPVDVKGFMGIAIEYDEELNGAFAPEEISNKDGIAMITSSGIGFTFIQNDKNSVYVFANGKGVKINLGIDLTADYNKFAINNNLEEGYTYFTLDEKLFCTVDWSGTATNFLDAEGNILLSTEIIYSTMGDAILAYTGADTHGFFDNLWITAVEYKVPEEKYVGASYEVAATPVPENTEAAQTEAPTDAPTEVPTEVPATDAPHEATKAPEKDSDGDKGGNTGLVIGIIAAAAVIAAVVAAVIIKKNKK